MEQIITDIGWRIRQAREQRGLTIRDVAHITKISPVALNAIENNDFARLPGGVYSRAYIRAFATEVGLGADDLTREYRARFELELTGGQPLPAHQGAGSEWAGRRYRLPAVLVVVAILIGGWMILTRAQVHHGAQDGRSTPSPVEVEGPKDAAPTAETRNEFWPVSAIAVTRLGSAQPSWRRTMAQLRGRSSRCDPIGVRWQIV